MRVQNKILLTTSRNPTPTIRAFINDLSRVLPNTIRVNRGKMSTDEVAEKGLEHKAERVLIVDRLHGSLGKIKFYQIGESGLVSVSPTIQIAGLRLQREFEVSKVKPAHSVVLSISERSEEMMKIGNAFSTFFGIPTVSMNEAVKIAPTLMYVSRDKTNRTVISFMAEPEHVEIGPRIVVLGVEW